MAGSIDDLAIERDHAVLTWLDIGSLLVEVALAIIVAVHAVAVGWEPSDRASSGVRRRMTDLLWEEYASSSSGDEVGVSRRAAPSS